MSTTHTTARPVRTDFARIYRAAKNFGSWSAIYRAVEQQDADALAIMDAMKADSKHESHAYGATACVSAALKGEAFATARQGRYVIDFV